MLLNPLIKPTIQMKIRSIINSIITGILVAVAIVYLPMFLLSSVVLALVASYFLIRRVKSLQRLRYRVIPVNR